MLDKYGLPETKNIKAQKIRDYAMKRFISEMKRSERRKVIK